jgi:glycosyltransferase involved in cell wall biosynthesis
MRQQLVSAIIPTYNRSKVIGRALESVLAQTYRNIEAIVVDDGSTDNTEEVVESYRARLGDRLIYCRQKNAGAAAARNTACDMANGDFIAMLDSDDLWAPSKTAIQLGSMLRTETEISFTGFYTFDDWTSLSSTVIPQKEFGPNIYPELLTVKYNVIVTPSVMVSSRLLKNIGGFSPDMSLCEDIDLWARMSRHHNASVIRAPLTGVHIRSNEAVPYRRAILARKDLLERALSRDPQLGEAFCGDCTHELLTAYAEIAKRRQETCLPQLQSGVAQIEAGHNWRSVLISTAASI